MVYLLLIVPHVLAMGGLFALAFHSDAAAVSDDADGGSGGNNGEQPPPRAPRPGPGLDGLPLPEASAPRRRMRAGEGLSERHPRRLRRGHAPERRERSPTSSL